MFYQLSSFIHLIGNALLFQLSLKYYLQKKQPFVINRFVHFKLFFELDSFRCSVTPIHIVGSWLLPSSCLSSFSPVCLGFLVTVCLSLVLFIFCSSSVLPCCEMTSVPPPVAHLLFSSYVCSCSAPFSSGFLRITPF